jgi:hypothetical protein
MKNKMKQIGLCIAVISVVATGVFAAAKKADTKTVDSADVAEYIKWFPAIKQVEMRDAWLQENKTGEWQFTGTITAKDRTVVTPQAGANYGYSWFNISKEPLVITMPEYDKYYSVSVFDMNHFMEVYVMPKKPVVVRLPHQTSPIKDAHEIVLQTYQGVVFTRQVIVNNEQEVMDLTTNMTLSGGGGDFPFVVPEFSQAVQDAGFKKIDAYVNQGTDTSKMFTSPYEGGGDLDRAAGALAGQLGLQARYVQYGPLVFDQNKENLSGKESYEIVVPKEGLIRNDNGYWTVTIYSYADRYLIPNDKNIYHISSYDAQANPDGTYTIRINSEGIGKNAIPSNGVDFYGVFRVYEPVENVKFPVIKKVSIK